MSMGQEMSWPLRINWEQRTEPFYTCGSHSLEWSCDDQKLLDVGVESIMVPMVENAEEGSCSISRTLSTERTGKCAYRCEAVSMASSQWILRNSFWQYFYDLPSWKREGGQQYWWDSKGGWTGYDFIRPFDLSTSLGTSKIWIQSTRA